MNDIDELLRLAKDEGLHMRGLQLLFLLRVPRYSSDICDVLGIKIQNLTSTVEQVGQYVKKAGEPGNMQRRWRLYSLNKRGEKFVRKLLNA